MSILYVYNPVVGGLIPGGPNAPHVAKALAQARTQCGDALWKAGFRRGPSGPTERALAALKEIDVVPGRLSGVVTKIATAKTGTDDGKNVFTKLRLTIGGNVVSLDMDTEVAMRLVQKLANAERGQTLILSMWAAPVQRAGRWFVNHCVSLETADGMQVPGIAGFWEKAQRRANETEKSLTALKMPLDVIKAAKAAAKVAEHEELAQALAKHFAEQQLHDKLEEASQELASQFENMALSDQEGSDQSV